MSFKGNLLNFLLRFTCCTFLYIFFISDIDLDENEEEMELMKKHVTDILRHRGASDDDENDDDINDNSDDNNGDNDEKDTSQLSNHSLDNSETKGRSKRVRNVVERVNDENMDMGNVEKPALSHEKKVKKKKIQIPAKEYEDMTQLLALRIKIVVSCVGNIYNI